MDDTRHFPSLQDITDTSLEMRGQDHSPAAITPRLTHSLARPSNGPRLEGKAMLQYALVRSEEDDTVREVKL